VRGVDLDRLQVLLRQEGVDDQVAALGVVPEDEERPVEEPGPLLELLLVAVPAGIDGRLNKSAKAHRG